jgi:hypothetical protein
MEKKVISHITKGLILAAIVIALDLIFQQPKLRGQESVQYLLRFGIVFAGIVASCVVFAKQTGGPLKFGEVFSHGFKATAVIAFLVAIYTFFAVKFIYPPPSAEEMEAAVKVMMQQKNVLEQEAKQLAAEAAKKRWIIYVSLSFFVSIIPGLLGSAIGGAVAKKNQ